MSFRSSGRSLVAAAIDQAQKILQGADPAAISRYADLLEKSPLPGLDQFGHRAGRTTRREAANLASKARLEAAELAGPSHRVSERAY